jgi:hypothetical protein
MDISKRLIIPSRSIEPCFKTLLFPHRHGEKLPITSWSDDKTVLTVEWHDQRDIIEFRKRDDGRTSLKITREGEEILNIE